MKRVEQSDSDQDSPPAKKGCLEKERDVSNINIAKIVNLKSSHENEANQVSASISKYVVLYGLDFYFIINGDE